MKTIPVKQIIEWDILNWSQLIKYWSPILQTLPRDSKILAVGERNGGLTLWLALAGFNVVCTDREGPTEKAILQHREFGVSDKVVYEKLDIVNNTRQANQFDLIISKSVIGGLKEDYSDKSTRNLETQIKAISQMYKLLKPGGYFLAAENMKGSILLHYLRKIKNKHSGWRYIEWNELPILFKDFSSTQINAFGVLPTLFSNNALNRVNFLMNKYIMGFMPKKIKYISFIAARK